MCEIAIAETREAMVNFWLKEISFMNYFETSINFFLHLNTLTNQIMNFVTGFGGNKAENLCKTEACKSLHIRRDFIGTQNQGLR